MDQNSFTINGVAVEPGSAAAARSVALPSGKTATIRKGLGRDLMRAQRAARSSEPSAIIFALIAELVQLDGRTIVYEDVLGMDLADVLMLQDEVVGGNFQTAASPPPPLSPDSSGPDSLLRS